MKKRGLFVLIILLFALSSYAQRFLPGYVLFDNGTRLEGFTKIAALKERPSVILFKPDLKARARKIFIRDIEEFTYGDNHYIKAYVLVDSTGYIKKNLKNAPAGKKDYEDWFFKDYMLLQVLFEGPKSLYRGYYNYKNLFYVRVGDSIALLEAPWFKEEDSVFRFDINRMWGRYSFDQVKPYEKVSKVVEFQIFKEQLRYYFEEMPQMKKDVYKTGYYFMDLYRLFKKYYDLTGKKPDYVCRLPFATVSGGLVAGANLNQAVFYESENSGFYYFTATDFQISTCEHIGGYLQMNVFETNYHLSFITSLSFYRFYAQGQGHTTTTYYKNGVDIKTALQVDFLRFDIKTAYYFILQPVRLGLYAGVVMNYPLAENSKTELTFIDYNGDTRYKEIDPMLSFYTHNVLYKPELSAVGGLSLRKGRFGLDVFAYRGNGFMAPLYLTQINTGIGLTLSYLIYKNN